MLTETQPLKGSEMATPQEPLDPDELVIVLIGASAVGKSAIAEYLSNADIVSPTPTWATRKPRPGEHDACYDHHFVSDEEFDRQEQAGGFVDVHTIYGERYGVPVLPKPPEGREALVVLKPVFMPVFLERYPGTRIYQIEASPVLLPRRMRDRGQSEEDIAVRMQHHTKEASDARRFADVVFTNNGPLEQTLEQVEVQIRADRAAHTLARRGQS